MPLPKRSALSLALLALACAEPATAPTPSRQQIVARIQCVGTVATHQVVCASAGDDATASASPTGTEDVRRDLILGGQNTHVTLTSSAITYVGEIFSFDVTVKNLLERAIGTTDGTTIDPDGVRVFYEQPPTITSGTGTIGLTNPVGGASLVDGYATFTTTNQPYYQYTGILAPDATSPAKRWGIQMSPTVVTFAFSLYVSVPIQNPAGYVVVSPSAASLRSGGATQALTAVVKDAVDRTISAAVTWSSSNPAVASVDASGVVTPVSQGTATITATSGARTGTAAITVSTTHAGNTTIVGVPNSLTVGSPSTITVQAKTSSGANMTLGGDVVLLNASAGSLGPVTDNNNGTYTATLNSTVATTISITGTVNSQTIGNAGSVTFVAGTPTSMVKSAGDGQSGAAGANVATAPAVTITDTHGNPVAGISVAFAIVTGGTGSAVTGTPVTTNAAGVATVGSWKLGNTMGANSMSATAGALTTTFTATGVAGAASQIAVNGGTGQSATAGTAVSTAPSVIVRDVNNNVVSGAPVTFSAVGGGSVTGANATTNAAGVATVGSWILGTTAGTNNYTLRATSGSLSGSPVDITASATAGTATQIAVNAGNNQSATVGTNVATAPSVIIRDQYGNPVSGYSVQFAVLSGGGSSLPNAPVTTNASGIAVATSWTLGTSAGASNNTLQALTGSLSGSPIVFTASATAGAATAIVANSSTSQSATVGTAVSAPPSVLVKDQYGNPVGAGTPVTFAVTAAATGGAVAGGGATTNSSGIATVTSWTLGTAAGFLNNTVTATSSGLAGSPVTFNATGEVGAPANVIIVAGDGQTAASGAAVSTLPKVRVRDTYSNPIAGVPVTFSVQGGNGSGSGFSTTTNSSGEATVGSWTLGSGGASCTSLANIANCTRNRLRATATGGSTPTIDFVANVPVFVPTAQYQTLGNVPLTVVNGSTDLTSQAYSINGANGVSGGTIVATAGTLAGSASGSAVVAADGSFTYTSSTTVSGAGITETFTYLVSDGIATGNTSASISVNLPSRVFYVQPGYLGTSTGTSAQPFKDFSTNVGQGVESVGGTNDLILVKTGSGSAAGGTLKQGQTVKGQGVASAVTHVVSSPFRNTGAITLLGTGTASQVANLVLFNIGSSSTANNTLAGLELVGTSGTALSGFSFGTLTVSETKITATGASGLLLNTGTMSGSFTSVSANGGSNGIALTSTSGVSVTGTSATAGTGGTIQNTSGSNGSSLGNGIYLSAATNTSLKNINMSGNDNNGVYATGNVTGLQLDNIQVTGSANGNSEASFDSPLRFENVSGGIKVQNSRFDGGAYSGISVANTSTGALDSLVFASNIISTMQGSAGDPRNHAIEIITNGIADLRLRSNTVNVWYGAAIYVSPTGTSAVTLRVTGNTLNATSGTAASVYGMRIHGQNVTYRIANNTLNNAVSSGILVSSSGVANSVHNGVIDGNNIGTAGGAGGVTGGEFPIDLIVNGTNSTSVTKIHGNVIRQVKPTAAGAISFLVQSTGVTMNATVTANNIQEIGSGTANNGMNGIFFNTGTSLAENGVACYDIGGSGLQNVISNLVSGTANNRIRSNLRFQATAKWPGYGGANDDNTALQNYLLGRNTASTALAANNVSAGGGGNVNTSSGAPCTQPTTLSL